MVDVVFLLLSRFGEVIWAGSDKVESNTVWSAFTFHSANVPVSRFSHRALADGLFDELWR